MELVPIITQVLTIVASIFVLVLLISFIASKLRKKELNESRVTNNSNQNRTFSSSGNFSDKSRYYGGSYSNGENSLGYPKEIKVVKRSSVAKTYSTNSQYKRTNTSNRNSRFTVINNISPVKSGPIETDEYGFKVYSDNEIARSVYLPN